MCVTEADTFDFLLYFGQWHYVPLMNMYFQSWMCLYISITISSLLLLYQLQGLWWRWHAL